eukprot:gene7728-8539_t
MLPLLRLLLPLIVLLATNSSCSSSSSHFARRLGSKLSLLSKGSKVALASALSCLALAGPLSSAPALADPPKQQQVYFGAGCFWHVQHEMVETERKVLGRQDSQITSLAAYAGGKEGSKPQRVCYHNLKGIPDYGSLGHAEVVSLTLPEDPDAFEPFAKTYFSLFSNKDRTDVGDRGAEYRSVIGIPGGLKGAKPEVLEKLQAAAKESGLRLEEGRGSDEDTLHKGIVYVYDSDLYPAHQAEVYHQFHDGFLPGESYPRTYNNLQAQALDNGLLHRIECPEQILF